MGSRPGMRGDGKDTTDAPGSLVGRSLQILSSKRGAGRGVWDRTDRLDLLPLSDELAARLLAPRSEAERLASTHVVQPQGTVTSGGEALLSAVCGDACRLAARRCGRGDPTGRVRRQRAGRRPCENSWLARLHRPGVSSSSPVARVHRTRRRVGRTGRAGSSPASAVPSEWLVRPGSWPRIPTEEAADERVEDEVDVSSGGGRV